MGGARDFGNGDRYGEPDEQSVKETRRINLLDEADRGRSRDKEWRGPTLFRNHGSQAAHLTVENAPACVSGIERRWIVDPL